MSERVQQMERSEATRFGVMLRRFRLAAGLSQEELAERARLTAHGISALERGARRAPYRETVVRLADALRLDPDKRRVLTQAVVRGRGAGPDFQPIAPSTTRAGTLPLIGRDLELTTLQRFLADDDSRVLAFAGEPGIGKSRVLDVAVDLAVASGWTVLRGGCHRRDGQEPYAPVLDALAQHLLTQPDVQQQTTLQGCAWLVRLLPELSHGPIESLPSWDLSARQERRLIAAAISRYLANVAGAAGTLLILDDLQWAGADALALLDGLIRAPQTRPVRVVGAYRDVEVHSNAPLAVLLADLAHAGYVTHRTLAPLNVTDAAHLLDAVLGADLSPQTARRERIIHRAGGVPFFLVSCAQEKSTAEAEAHGHDAVPWGVAQSIRQRVGALSDASRLVLAAAAVIGRLVDPDLLARVVDLSPVEVAEGLAESCQARILVDGAANYQFTHDLIREVLETDVGSAGRTLLHQRIGQVLENKSGEPPVDLLAFHFARGRVADKAIRYLELAGDNAEARFAHAAAIGHYQDLVELLDDQGQKREAARARAKLGLVLEYVGRYDTALGVLDQAADAYRAMGATSALAPVVARIGIVFGHLGQPDKGLSRLTKFVKDATLEDIPRGLMMVFLAMAALLYKCGRYGDELDRASQASELARLVGDNRALAEAERLRAQAHHAQGHLEEALQLYATVIPLAERADNLNCLAWVFNNIGNCEVLRGHFIQSQESVERALELVERIGDLERTIFFRMHHGFIAFFQGNWSQARSDGERALAMSRATGSPSLGAHPLMVLGQVAFGEGGWDDAVRCLEETVRLAEGTDPTSMEIAQGVLAEIDLREGRPSVACARLAPLYGGGYLEHRNAGFWLPRLAWAHLECGDLSAARDVVHHGLAIAFRSGARLHLVEALRVQALLTIRERDWAAGRAIVDDALTLARDIGYPHGEGRVLQLSGVLEVELGRPQQAREHFEASLVLFQQLGAVRDSAETQRMIDGAD